MRMGVAVAALALMLGGCNSADKGFVPLFNGENLDGWSAAENPDTFAVKDGMIVVDGPRGHLFYSGDVENHQFHNFHFSAEVMTRPNANSGLYFHTKYQEQGWPTTGYEAQVNNTHKDPRKTGSLYAVQDVNAAPAADDQWFTYEIIVAGKHVVIKIDGETTVEWTEPDDWQPQKNMPDRYLRGGTFAIQGHDPKSVVYFRNIKVKPLP